KDAAWPKCNSARKALSLGVNWARFLVLSRMTKPSLSGLTAKESMRNDSSICPMGRSNAAYVKSSIIGYPREFSARHPTTLLGYAFGSLQVHSHPKIIQLANRKRFFQNTP